MQDNNLYRFVKASERLPDNPKPPKTQNYPCRINDCYWDLIFYEGAFHSRNGGIYTNDQILWLEKVEADQQEIERVVTEILTKCWTTPGVLGKLQEHFTIIPKS